MLMCCVACPRPPPFVNSGSVFENLQNLNHELILILSRVMLNYADEYFKYGEYCDTEDA